MLHWLVCRQHNVLLSHAQRSRRIAPICRRRFHQRSSLLHTPLHLQIMEPMERAESAALYHSQLQRHALGLQCALFRCWCALGAIRLSLASELWGPALIAAPDFRCLGTMGHPGSSATLLLDPSRAVRAFHAPLPSNVRQEGSDRIPHAESLCPARLVSAPLSSPAKPRWSIAAPRTTSGQRWGWMLQFFTRWCVDSAAWYDGPVRLMGEHGEGHGLER